MSLQQQYNTARRREENEATAHVASIALVGLTVAFLLGVAVGAWAW